METYFVTNTINSYVKIGVTSDIVKRVAQLKGQISFINLKLEYSVQGNYEKFLHEYYKKHRISGEWFDMSLPTKEFTEMLIAEYIPVGLDLCAYFYVKSTEESKRNNKYSTNPFMKELVAKIGTKKVDSEYFVKVYNNKLKNFFAMPRSAGLVFKYILDNLDKDQDQIYLYERALSEYSQLSGKSCFRGVAWLLEHSIIANTARPCWFFINPSLFFNGNRLTLVNTYQNKDLTKRSNND